MKNKIDDSWELDTFRLIEKFYNTPENLTPKERKRLKELGILKDEKRVKPFSVIR
jgi:hypothetical protein